MAATRLPPVSLFKPVAGAPAAPPPEGHTSSERFRGLLRVIRAGTQRWPVSSPAQLHVRPGFSVGLRSGRVAVTQKTSFHSPVNSGGKGLGLPRRADKSEVQSCVEEGGPVWWPRSPAPPHPIGCARQPPSPQRSCWPSAGVPAPPVGRGAWLPWQGRNRGLASCPDQLWLHPQGAAGEREGLAVTEGAAAAGAGGEEEKGNGGPGVWLPRALR